MVSQVTSLNGRGITGSDGPIGTIIDLLFDEAGWRIRWLIVKTDAWLAGRPVLLPALGLLPALALGQHAQRKHTSEFDLTRRQVKASPEIPTVLPISRHCEMEVLDYYGLPPYWSTVFTASGIALLNGTAEPPPYRGSRRREEDIAISTLTPDDTYLRSTADALGTVVQADDGEIGEVEDLLWHEHDGSIRFLVVDAARCWPGRKILIAPRSTRQINWIDRNVRVNVTCQQVRDSPLYEPSTIIDASFEDNFLRYYDRAFAANRRRANLVTAPSPGAVFRFVN